MLCLMRKSWSIVLVKLAVSAPIVDWESTMIFVEEWRCARVWVFIREVLPSREHRLYEEGPLLWILGPGEVCGLVCLVVVEVENWNWSSSPTPFPAGSDP